MNNEKKRLEEAAISWFIDRYESMYGRKYSVLHHYGEDDIGKPDFILKSDNREIAVEVTHLFIDEQEAQTLLGKTDEHLHEPKDIHDLIDSLNNLISKKAEKDYRYPGPIELVIRSASPLFSSADFLAKFRHIDLDNTERFHHVWLLAQDDELSRWSLIKLK